MTFPQFRFIAVLAVLLMIGAWQRASADTASSKIPSPAVTTNASPVAATNAAPQSHGITITMDTDDDDDSSAKADSGKKHGVHADLGWGEILVSVVVPIAGIAATFGTPLLIIFFVCYFRYLRRREALATVREYLNKGLPVPPELLDGGGAAASFSTYPLKRRKSDLTRGFQLTFIGLGITLALLVADPHSSTWGWGLIPMIMGIGYLLSGWVQNRSATKDEPLPPPGNPPSL
jgi:hypothetical protein